MLSWRLDGVAVTAAGIDMETAGAPRGLRRPEHPAGGRGEGGEDCLDGCRDSAFAKVRGS